MFFHQYQLGCLSHFSYMLGDTTTGRAVVVDPQRDVGIYLADATARGLSIERVIETHVHADFVSGHLELAESTGAVISYGEGTEAEFPVELLTDGQRLSLGDVVLEVRATPGHTPESISIVIWEHARDDSPWGVLTGDTLFVGDVGRPDLMASAGVSPEDAARQLYRSLREVLLTLPDDTRVFPTHGAGSACGRAIASAPASTIGEQRRHNRALAPTSEEAFVAMVGPDQPTAPAYFGFAASTNRRTHQLFADHDGSPRLSFEEVLDRQCQGAVLIDGRAPQTFARGHLRGSINVPLDGRFAEWAGNVVAPDLPIIVVTDPGREGEARTRLARIGFDNTVGHLPEIDALLVEHPEHSEVARRIPASDLAAWILDDPELQIIDVRNPSEQVSGTIAGAKLLPLPVLRDRVSSLDPDRPTVIVCASGTRSSVAASLLRATGFTEVADVLGGFDAYRRRSQQRSRGLTACADRRSRHAALVGRPFGQLVPGDALPPGASSRRGLLRRRAARPGGVLSSVVAALVATQRRRRPVEMEAAVASVNVADHAVTRRCRGASRRASVSCIASRSRAWPESP